MTKWHVEWVDKATNDARSIDVFAEDGAAAHAQAEKAGIHVITVRAIPEATDAGRPTAAAPIAYAPSRLRLLREMVLRKNVLWWATVTRVMSSLALAAAVAALLGGYGGIVGAVLLGTAGTIGFTVAAICELLAGGPD